MDTFSSLMHGFSVAMTPGNLMFCFIGCLAGTIVGILPGLGPAATIALLLPLSFNLDPAGGIIMLTGIYYGAKYGGSTTSILLNMPGESSSVVSCLDGYQMAKKGRAGAALGIAAIASFIAGTVGIVALTLLAPQVARVALSFGPPEYFGLMVLGLSLATVLSGPSLLKGTLALLIGLTLAGVGTDIFTSTSRFTFGRPELIAGLDFVVIAIGLFALAELFSNLVNRENAVLLPIPRGIRNLLPSWEELRQCRFAFLNGSVTGFVVGVLPGAGSAIASFLAYGIEKAVSKHPEKFGTGVPEGLAAPEGANNADTGGALIPLLTLGIPGGGTTAILLTALIAWGVRPGPLMMIEAPDVFWGLVASMYIGNVMLLLLNLPLVPVFSQLLRVPGWLLGPIIFGLATIGAYSVAFRIFDLWLLMGFALAGFVLTRARIPLAPLILGFVLGDMMERALRQSMMMSDGSLSIFAERGLTVSLLALAVAVLVGSRLSILRKSREAAISEAD